METLATDHFLHAKNTIVLSDIHLADAEPPHPKNPLWKRFKRKEFFIDPVFRDFIEYLLENVEGPIELVLNGDIFDFDSVMKIPSELSSHITWLERHRGLSSEEVKSRFKIKAIFQDHDVWVAALRKFLMAGNRVVFVIGNHDMELHWTAVRQDIVEMLKLPDEVKGSVRFCEWFYISNQDTLIEHGDQYDDYSLCANPIHPLIRKGHKTYVRIPFGNLAGRFIVKGMGLFNPHSEASYIKSSFVEYMEFYYKYVVRTQPFLMWTWFWGAIVTLFISVHEGHLPAMSDPLTVPDRVKSIAERSNATPSMVWTMKELHVHPAIFNPFKVLRELWLDRAILLGLIFFASFQFFTFMNVFTRIPLVWMLAPMSLLTPLFIFYAKSVESDVLKTQRNAFEMAPLAAQLAGVRRVIHGHTHLEKHTEVGGIEYLNTGTWSYAFKDVECTQPYGRKCFAWLRPSSSGEGRVAELYEWKETSPVKLEPTLP